MKAINRIDAGYYSVPELLACFISRDLEDGGKIGIGQNLAIARAGVLLAHLTHAPNMIIHFAYTTTNLLHVPKIGYFELESDQRGAIWGESVYVDEQDVLWIRDKIKKFRFFIGGLQIDKYGNSNLIGIGPDYKRLKVRGPGGVGTCMMSANAKYYYIILNNHDKRTLVDKCDYISALGYGDGPGTRQRLGLPGGGPKYCITPFCIMDFDEKTRRMRLKSVHPGVTIEQVLENTGFDLVIPKNVPITEPPTEEELEILRARCDPEGVLRQGVLQ